MPLYTEEELFALTNEELKTICGAAGLTGYYWYNKSELVGLILDTQDENGDEDDTELADGDEVTEIVEKIRKAHREGMKVARLRTTDQDLIEAIKAQLTDEEQTKVAFGCVPARNLVILL